MRALERGNTEHIRGSRVFLRRLLFIFSTSSLPRPCRPRRRKLLLIRETYPSVVLKFLHPGEVIFCSSWEDIQRRCQTPWTSRGVATTRSFLFYIALNALHIYICARVFFVRPERLHFEPLKGTRRMQQRAVIAPSVDQTSSMRQVTSMHCSWPNIVHITDTGHSANMRLSSSI